MATVLMRLKDHFFEKHSRSVPPAMKSRNSGLSQSVRDQKRNRKDIPQATDNQSATSSHELDNTENKHPMDDKQEAGVGTGKGDTQVLATERVRSKTDGSLIRSLSQFERLCTIGTGTFGRVVLVNRRKTHDYFALKVVSIRHVVHKHQINHVHNEKDILESIRHPFIVKLCWTWHDSKCLYLLFEYIPGGELFSYLRASTRFSPNTARFYACELISALEYLHYLNIVYRDLKPENLLLEKNGHLKIVDFGFAKILQEKTRTNTLCGTPEYLAPEIIEQKGHDRTVDWWGMGVLLYEMMVGHPPFRGMNVLETYELILEAKVKFPKNFQPLAKDCVRKFLQVDPNLRLGSADADATEVKDHRWFKDIDWIDVYHCRVPPPIIPTLYHEGDTGNYDAYNEQQFADFPEAPEKELAYFKNF